MLELGTVDEMRVVAFAIMHIGFWFIDDCDSDW